MSTEVITVTCPMCLQTVKATAAPGAIVAKLATHNRVSLGGETPCSGGKCCIAIGRK